MTTVDNVVQMANDRARRLGAVGVIAVDEWLALCERFGHRCLRCGEQKPLEIEHVEPLSKGGANTIDNIQPLCRGCNRRKHTKSTDYRLTPFTTDVSGDKPSGAASFRYRGQMEQQIQDLLLHYEKLEGVPPTLNDLLVRLVAQAHRQTFPDRHPRPEPAIIAWVKGRTSRGEEGYLPVVEGGAVLDYIDDDIDD